MKASSVRTRILWGAVFWTIGLFMLGVIIATIILLRNRHFPILMHGSAMAHTPIWAVIIVLTMIAGAVQFRRAFSPLNELRERLGRVRAGRESRIDGRYPSEVQPLVNDLNALIDHQDQAVRRAVAKAGDLAHGLKTPLAVLTQEAERARAAGHEQLAASLGEQVQRMQRQVDYHLAHARAAASGAMPGATSSVRQSAEGLVRTLQRLHAERSIVMEVRVDAAHCVRVQREDLDEMLGNLLDNACKWTRSRVLVSSEVDGEALRIAVEDDGPGVPAAKREAVLQRGVRADESAPGSGFGLAIVRELAELYGGTIHLEPSAPGGLRAVLRLPRVPGVRS